MNSLTTRTLALTVLLGCAIFLLDRFAVPAYGMAVSQGVSAVLVLGSFALYVGASSRDPDEREQLLRLQADSATLYLVVLALLAASIFYPHSALAMTFWLVLGLVGIGRIGVGLYQRYR